jgi:hypothetical protein
MQDRRSVKRTHMLKHGKIIAQSATIDCMIYDLTNSGAGLRISPGEAVPDHFELIFDSALFSRKCRVQWRNNERLGVAFFEAQSTEVVAGPSLANCA